MDESLAKLVRKWALFNAVKYNGKAELGSVIGKLISEHPEVKKQLGVLAKDINQIVKKVNSLPVDDQRKELEETAPELLVEKKSVEAHELPSLPNAEIGKVVTAFPPEPSGYSHLGHAKAALVNYQYAKNYNGKFVLRFEDTNPELAKLEFYTSMIEYFHWLGIHWDELVYISDTMPLLYKKGEELLSKGVFYACTCEPETVKRKRLSGESCKCREQPTKTNLKLWKEMLDGIHEKGDVVIRWKGDMQSKNTAMRDPSMFRISKVPHVRHDNKYGVWPSYDFAAAFSDGFEGITHRVRSKEFELRAEVQRELQRLMGFKPTIIIEQARFNLEGVEASKRKIREKIREGVLSGWDDPRLTTLVALKRRGFVPDGLKNFLFSLGVTKHESTITWDMLYAENRKVIDPLVNRYFLVADPAEITIEQAPEQTCKVPLHPDFPDRGNRELKTSKKFLVEKKDVEGVKNSDLYRLMDCLNFVSKNNKLVFDSREYEVFRNRGKKIIHWLPADSVVSVDVVMPDASVKHCFGESNLRSLKEDTIVQFVRFGFCRLDKREDNKLTFWFAHP